MAAPIVRTLRANTFQFGELAFLARSRTCPVLNYVPVMAMRHKFHDPKFRDRRREKILFFDREKRQRDRMDNLEKMTESERVKYFRDENRIPKMPIIGPMPRIVLRDTDSVRDTFVPMEGNALKSNLIKEKSINILTQIKKKVQASVSAIRKIKKYEDDFNLKNIAIELQDLYIEALTLLNNPIKNKSRLFDLLTRHAYGTMLNRSDRLTIRWEFVEVIQPPKAVHVTCEAALLKDLLFAQVTVRIHIRQKLAIYDQFGRLMYGDPDQPRDVMEFVVFEKMIVDLYGTWRVLDKIVPDWMPVAEKVNRSIRLENEIET